MIFISINRKVLYLSLVSFVLLCIAGFSLIIFAIGCSTQKGYILIPPEQVIKEHFIWQNEKNIERVEEMLTDYKKRVGWNLDNIEYIRVINIVVETKDAWVERYKRWAIRDGIKPENACLYLVQFEVKFINELFSNYPSGKHSWHYYLIRKDKNSPWLIADWAGY